MGLDIFRVHKQNVNLSKLALIEHYFEALDPDYNDN